MKIIKLDVENVKRISAAHIEPGGAAVVVGGQNGAGKSSVLDAIAYALAGRKAICERPLRDGAEHGEVTVDLGEVKVTRTFTKAGGGTLRIETADGMSPKSPQTWLDERTKALSFDPLEFSRMEPKRQGEVLRKLVGLDFTALDAERAAVFAQRTDVNREAKRLQANAESIPVRTDLPAEPVSVAALAQELAAAQESERTADLALRAAAQTQADATRKTERVAELKRTLALAEQDRDEATKRFQGADKAAREAREAIIPQEPIRAKLAGADELNADIRDQQSRAKLLVEAEIHAERAADLTARLDAIDAEKAAKLATAPFPVPGLSFDEGGVTYQGVPFAQASSAEQLRVSVAMGLALNPTIQVLLVRDASLLDSENLKLVASMAEEADAQVWLERVGDGPECSVVIEEGHVR